MSAITTFFTGWGSVSLLFAVIWLVQLKTHNASIIDAWWSWSLGALGVFYAVASPGDVWLRALAGGMIGIWALRLGTFIWRRNHGKPEDVRYTRLREEHGAPANGWLFYFFMLQGIFSMALSLGVLVAVWRPDQPHPAMMVLALLIWVVSIVGESVADAQLAGFKRDPANKGKVCRAGLWNYSRHPNYFFECLHWFAYVALAAGGPWWFLALLAPATMALLLLKLSGVPLNEAQSARTRPGYADYIATTSPLIPWPPKKTSR